jgi:hypothetical protein
MADQYSASIYDDPEKILAADPATMVVLNDYERSKNHLIDKMRDKWNEWYRAYRAYVEHTDDDIRSNLIIAAIFAAVEAFIPRLVANRPRIEVWPRGPEDRVRAAQHRAKLDYDWDHMGMPFKTVNMVKGSMIFGTGWYKAYHKKDTRIRIVKKRGIVSDPNSLFGYSVGMKEVEEPVPVWDDPQVDVLEPDEVFPDPDGKDEDSCAWIIHRYEIDLHTLENATRNGEPLYDQAVVAKLKKLGEHGNPEHSAQANANSIREDRESTFGPEGHRTVDPHKRRFHMIEKWSDDKVVAVIEEEPKLAPVRNARNPYGIKPFARYTPIPDPNAILGISLAEILYANQLEISTLHNARMDHVLQSVHNMMTVRRGSNLNPQNIRIRPGGYVFVDDHDDIDWLQPPRMDFALYRESDDLRLWQQQIGGATDTFSGVRSAVTGKTATEAALLSQASGSRAGLMYQLYGMQCLNRLGRILMRINEAELLNEKRLPAISGEFPVVQPSQLAGGTGLDLEVRIDVAETEPETRLFRRKEYLEAIQTIGQLYGPNHPITQKFIIGLAETYDIDNAEQMAQVPVPMGPGQGDQAAPGAGGIANEISAQMGAGGAPGAGDGRLIGVA